VDGTPFGRYRLVELLGRGGMGEVWRAHDTVTDRVVAIKVLPAHLSVDEDFQRRFRREAHAAARLGTPHVVPIHDYGEIDGRLFVSMRLIEGRDLDTVLADGPLEPARAVRIIDQVAKALHAAHKVGLLHRDIKPSNILLDGDDFAYLIDFGIARAADETRMTKSGNTIGTFAYIAPERLDSTVEEDARADIYSLACVLYEALTGQPPFAGSTTAQLMFAHISTPPPRPSTSQPNVPAQFDRVIAKGMAKGPDQRYATTIELANAAQDAITTPLALSSEPTLLDDQTRPAPAPQHGWQQPAYLYPAATQQRGSPPDPQARPADRPLPDTRTPPRQPWWRRQAIMIPAALLTVAVVAAAILVTVITSQQQKTTSKAPSMSTSTMPTSSATSAPPTSTAPRVREDRLSSILLTVDEGNAIMGSTDMQDFGGPTTPDTNLFTVSNADCLGAAHIVQPAVYADSGYTAVKFDVLREQGQRYTHSLEQGVTTFPAAEQALSFVQASAAKWKACAGQSVSDGLNGTSLQWTFANFAGDPPKISLIMNRHNARGWACQRALSAVWNLVIDVKACDFKIGNEGVVAADKIAANATQ
jgi:serine/threonine protein kinase